MTSVEAAAIRSVNRTTATSSALSTRLRDRPSRRQDQEAVARVDGRGRGRGQETPQRDGAALPRSRERRERVDDAGALLPRDLDPYLHPLRDRRVRAID